MGSEHEEYVKKELEKRGFVVYPNGMPDFIAVNPRKKQVIFVEAKKHPKEQLATNQKKLHAQFLKIGISIYVCCGQFSEEKFRCNIINFNTDHFVELYQAEIKRLVMNGNIVQEIVELRRRNVILKEENTHLKAHQAQKGRRNKNSRMMGRTTQVGVSATWLIAFQNPKLTTEKQVIDFMHSEFFGKNSKIFDYPNTIVGHANRGGLTHGLIPNPKFKQYPNSTQTNTKHSLKPKSL